MIAVDLDNTVCDTLAELRRRLQPPLVADRTVAWSPFGATKSFWAERGNDVFEQALPYPGAAEALRELARTEAIAYVSARPASAAGVTVAWLTRHGFPDGWIALQADDKPAVAARLGCTVAIEDDPKHVAAYRAAGVRVLVPRRGYNETVASGDLFEEWYEVLLRLPRWKPRGASARMEERR